MSALLLPALAAGSSGQGAPYVDDVFSTYLYTGNGSTQTINNGIDLAGEGGLVWIKGRSGATDHALYDTLRGATFDLVSNSQAAQTTQTTGLTAFSNTGFSVGSLAKLSTSAATYTSWTFRRAPKFFDVVTYTGNGVAGRQIPHSLGVQAGFVAVKATSTTGDWDSYHRSATGDLKLNTTAAQTASRTIITAADASTFTVSGAANTNGVSYVAYLWAHDTSAEGIIQCGSYTGNGSATGSVVTLGWEPQYLMIKTASGTGNWQIIDSMRGMPVGSADATLQANLSNAESSVDYVSPTATGFQVTSTSSELNASGATYIYLAIRRPNKPPTSGTQVYSSSTASGVVNAGFPVDLHIGAVRAGAANNHAMHARLTGGTRELVTSSTAAEATITDLGFDSMTGIKASLSAGGINHFFRRAPGFMDVVCYEGNLTSNRVLSHNLGVKPQLAIIKARTSTDDNNWTVILPSIRPGKFFQLNTAGSYNGNPITGLTTTSITLLDGQTNNSVPYVAHLFATLAGISKVGSYTGNGTSQTIDCGFSTGARFFLVKAASATGSWWVYDSARGIVSAADPALQLNSTAAEITSADAVDPTSAGIVVNQEATCSINATGVSYIFLAIA